MCSFNMTLKLVGHICLTLVLLVVYVVQGVFMDIFIIRTNTTNSALYFWLVPDFLLVFGFAGLMVSSYRYQVKESNNASNENGNVHQRRDVLESWWKKHKNVLGSHPYIYILWFIYSSILVIKIVVIFKSEIVNTVDEDDYLINSQLLKFLLAMTCFIFILLTEGHHNASPNTNQYIHIISLYSGNALEILDSIAFLELLIQSDSKLLYSFSLENIIIAFACVNFFLPGIILYKMSLSNLGDSPLNIVIFAYKFLHLSLVNVPYLVIRLYFWTAYGSDLSLFVVKNLMHIFITLCGCCEDVRGLVSFSNTFKSKRSHLYVSGQMSLKSQPIEDDASCEAIKLDQMCTISEVNHAQS